LQFLAEQAGVPAGVLQVLTGSSRVIGEALTASETVRKFSFTGSTEVGSQLMQQCAPTVKKMSLELGGNAPFIVFDDADIDAAIAGALAAKFRNAGQTCVCANRLLVQEAVYDEFCRKWVDAVQRLKVGDGMAADTDIGPLINQDAIVHTEKLLQDALAKGADLATGGSADGNFFQPTVLLNATPEMSVFKEEIFAPIAPVFRFADEKEAIALANDTEFGLAAYFYSKDLSRCLRVAEALEYGMVGVNTGMISNAAAPFGGIKQSGFGREGSKYGLDDYLELKYIAIGGV
ncbi:MAG: aldehyde dehydrogenase family protein, partial [Neisseria sp.]|nr:aldehyde dehydrogenase family protein [Neisseria sp.]